MGSRESRRQPTPRKRPSVREASRGRSAAQDGGGRRRQQTAAPRERSSANRGADSQGRVSTNRETTSRGRVSTRRTTTARGRSSAERTTTARAGSIAIDRKWIALIGAAVVVVVLIVALAFALGGKRDEPESGASQTTQAGSSVVSHKSSGPFSVNFTTTGDLIFWREVAEYIDMNGGASAMAGIADMLSQADVTISNVESPLSDNDSEPVYDKDVYIIGRPSAIEGIKNSGIDIASLANNHIMDYTGPALQDTLSALDAAGILHAGAGMTEADAEKPVETTVNGASIAFFSWTDIVPDNFVAFGNEPGVVSARLSMNDTLRRVREAKEVYDIVIVAMHWGIEYQDYIDESQQSTPAHQLVDAGADVVLGNHPHVPQGIEFYNGALIAYAHGNCVFRQDPSYGHTHESYVLNFDITQDGINNVTATPLYLDDAYGIPSVATGEQAQTTLSHIAAISEGMNTAFDVRDGKAYISPLDGK